MHERKAQPAPLKARCLYRVGTGIAFPAQLTDLTADTARIEGISRQLSSRDRLTVTFGGLAALNAEVHMIERGKVATLRFMPPLYPAVFTYVLARLRGARDEGYKPKKPPAIRACS